ncbi:hypothetical protein C8R47DRAFT_1281330 [Mycena vitilis]|nr:hypothetical protein C8R47DRAFT_1281330 [Mycena vitilis]
MFFYFSTLLLSNSLFSGTLFDYETSNEFGTTYGVHYTIASHLYSNPAESHFIARYTSDGTHVYDYDGCQHDGNAILNPANMKSLTGLTDSISGIPDGYNLTCVVYQLDGGEPAQRYFRQEQVRLASKMGLHLDGPKGRIPSSCEFRRKNVRALSDKERSSWLPRGSSAVDYVVETPEKSPKKATTIRRQSSFISIHSDDDTREWHPPMAPLPFPPSEPSSPNFRRDDSLPPIATMLPPAPKPPSVAAPRVVRCNPCETDDIALADDPDLVKCRRCLFWSHISCVEPLEYSSSDTGADSLSLLSWHDLDFNFYTPECDPALYRDSIYMLPAIEQWLDETIWMPAKFVQFDAAHVQQEYEFEWVRGIAVAGELDLDSRTFFRSAAHWEAAYSYPRLRNDQICSVFLPVCFAEVPEGTPSLDLDLSRLFDFAVPEIAKLLANMDTQNPVIANHENYFDDDDYNTIKAIIWMNLHSFHPTPGLEAMLTRPLDALLRHPLLAADDRAVHKVFGLGSVFFQLLAIQHSLGQPWNLNGETFLEIVEGRLVAAAPPAAAALDAMWASADPIYVAGDNNLSTAELATFETIFRAAHTRYLQDPSVVFYEYIMVDPTNPPSPPLPPIYITRGGRRIRFANELPALPRTRPVKRDVRATEGADEQSRPKKGKYQPQPTPEGVRRSSRFQDG